MCLEWRKLGERGRRKGKRLEESEELGLDHVEHQETV